MGWISRKEFKKRGAKKVEGEVEDVDENEDVDEVCPLFFVTMEVLLTLVITLPKYSIVLLTVLLADSPPSQQN